MAQVYQGKVKNGVININIDSNAADKAGDATKEAPKTNAAAKQDKGEEADDGAINPCASFPRPHAAQAFSHRLYTAASVGASAAPQ